MGFRIMESSVHVHCVINDSSLHLSCIAVYTTSNATANNFHMYCGSVDYRVAAWVQNTAVNFDPRRVEDQVNCLDIVISQLSNTISRSHKISMKIIQFQIFNLYIFICLINNIMSYRMYMARTMSCCDNYCWKNIYYNWIYCRKIKVHHCKRDQTKMNVKNRHLFSGMFCKMTVTWLDRDVRCNCTEGRQS